MEIARLALVPTSLTRFYLIPVNSEFGTDRSIGSYFVKLSGTPAYSEKINRLS